MTVGNPAFPVIIVIMAYVVHICCGRSLLLWTPMAYAWASNYKAPAAGKLRYCSGCKSKQLTGQVYKNLQKRYRNIMTRGEKELPPIPSKQNGKRGKVAKSDAHNLWERLKKHETAVLLFAKVSHVPFTNNRAERDLRMSTVKKEVISK